MKTFNYSEFLDRATSMAGLDSASLSSTERQWFDTWFNRNISLAWQQSRWPWACLTEARVPTNNFIPFIATATNEIEDVFEAYADNPLTFSKPRTIPYIITDLGISLIYASSITSVYVYFRTVSPIVSGSVFNVASVYPSGAKVWYKDGSGVIDYWKANATTTAGDTPGVSAKWDVVKLPRDLLECLSHAVYADYLRFDGQVDKASVADAEADSILFQAIDKVERQNRQFQTTNFFTHINSRGYR
jgi:hypothetical protein